LKLPIDRFAFSPLPSRPPVKLPGNSRVGIYLVVNVEDWDIEKPVPRTYFGAPQGTVTIPDVPNWSWHEYGMRVGIWRLIDAVQQRSLKASTAINARVCEYQYEPVARAMRDAGWNFMGHSYRQGTVHTLADQNAVIRQTFNVLKQYTGTAPKGWLGPGLHQTWDTLDFLAQAGFQYVVDWPLDDQPFDMNTVAGPIVAMPYTLELSDLPMMVAHQHESSVWLSRVKDHFDRLYQEGEKHPRFMSMSVHPYIIGAPHRIAYFEKALDYILGHENIWFTTAEDIYDWHRARTKD
jgi:allantoinase